MMCFLYDEQFPVLPDIIQISGPDQANYRITIISDIISRGDELYIHRSKVFLSASFY